MKSSKSSLIPKTARNNIDHSLLLRQVAKGDQDALARLYDRYKVLVYSIAHNVVGNREDAEEIAIDVFSQIWEKAGSYNPERASVTAWISSLARYRSIDTLRRRTSRFNLHNPKWSDACIDCMPSQDNPLEDVETALTQKEVSVALAELPANQKEALSLSYFKGLSHGQIAEALNEPVGTVKTRIRSAMQSLRKKLLEPETVK
jgi:RNA polymerase sigma factor (sigma-70 family)